MIKEVTGKHLEVTPISMLKSFVGSFSGTT
jgi:hypothetical protein